jgi:hypothetical protein
MLADSGEVNSQSPELRSVSGDELYTPQVLYVTGGEGVAVHDSQAVTKTSQFRETSWL